MVIRVIDYRFVEVAFRARSAGIVIRAEVMAPVGAGVTPPAS
jgi:hypothetical protein